MAQQNDGWNVVSVAPIPKSTPVQEDGWNVASVSPASNAVAGAGPLGVPQLANYSKSAAATSVLQPPTGATLTSNLVKAGATYKGAAKSIPATISGASKAINSIPVVGPLLTGSQFDPQGYNDATSALDKAAQTDGSAEQNYGKAVGNVAQYLVPGLGEEEAGAAGLRLLPALGRYAAPAGRLALNTMGTAAVNKAQGGSFLGGAASGAIGGGAGELFRAAAPALAETALGVRATDRAYNRTPGLAILNETTGVSPRSIANQAQAKVTGYTTDLNDAAAASPMMASLDPARAIVDNAYDQALMRNNDSTIKGVKQLQNQLYSNSAVPGAGSASPIQSAVTPQRLLNLKQGVSDFRSTFNPTVSPDFVDSTAGKAYHALDQELDRTVPGANELNQKISTLLPVAKRAGAADLNASVLQRVVGRVARPTGAMLGATAGGYEGYQRGGVEGALLGGAAGLVLPEIAASPTTLMTGARVINAAPALAPAIGGVGAKAYDRLNRKNPFLPPQ
jgi:hypothetical protein